MTIRRANMTRPEIARRKRVHEMVKVLRYVNEVRRHPGYVDEETLAEAEELLEDEDDLRFYMRPIQPTHDAKPPRRTKG